MVDYYPPWGFYYKVEFDISKDKNDVRFQTVSGLSVEYDYENFKEGGENRFEHKLPVRTKYADLVLKRGMLVDSAVIKWFLDAFRDRQFKPAEINVILMNEKGQSLRSPTPSFRAVSVKREGPPLCGLLLPLHSV